MSTSISTAPRRTRGSLALLSSLLLLAAACTGGGGEGEPGSATTTTAASDESEPEAEPGSVTAATIERMLAMDPTAAARAHDHHDHHGHHDGSHLPNSVDPERIVIDAIGVDADIIDLGYQADGEIEVPTDFAQTGWFTSSPRPGRVGSSVIAGHVDSVDGPAVFFALPELEEGDEITIHGADGDVVVFAVTAVEQHAKSEFPADQVHASTGKPELKLVTCGGVFDAGERSYRDNIIVSAERVDDARAAG